ncbi:SurA N-terminal domain-containing protein [Oceanobacillus sp. CFH 90083]|uniref:SurA N-terminal domain-containing protein n=1 Tax=Oceanobacillus sp. CFH 90083 TaxID=2592336 RepID=UPI00128C86B4|nr:SurA N-terminal domain-containing protein [Oceanobacillus sp. CFH 90083]
MKKLSLTILMILTMLLAACGNDDNGQEEAAQQPQEPEPVEFSEDEFVDSDTSVVVVNGEELQGNDYNTAYSLVKSMMHQAGQDVTDLEALQDETISFLVEQELVMQEANDQGVEVTDEEVQEEMDALKEQGGEEQFQTSLEQLNLSEEQFAQQLRYNLATMHYMEKAFDIEVTEEEVQDMYDELSAQMEGQEMQDLDEIRDQLEQMVEQNKQQEAYADKIDELRKSAEVEELL